MNTRETRELVVANGIVPLRADKSKPSPEIDQFLVELGNTGKAIPFYAIFPAGGGDPILLSGVVTQAQILEALRQAGPSRSQQLARRRP